jgi:hypothetical protein
MSAPGCVFAHTCPAMGNNRSVTKVEQHHGNQESYEISFLEKAQGMGIAPPLCEAPIRGA